MLQMGAEPTEMLTASLNQRNGSRQQAWPPFSQPTLPADQGYGPASRGRRNGKTVPKKSTSTDIDEMVAKWGQFAENIAQHDEQLRQKLLSTGRRRYSGTVIRDVYQPTTLATGQRVGSGSKVVQQVQIPYSQVAAGLTSGQSTLIPEIQIGMDNLTLGNGSHAQGDVLISPPDAGSLSSSTTAGRQPRQPPGLDHCEGNGFRTNPITAAGRTRNVPVQEVPIPSYEATLDLLTAQFGPLIRTLSPPPGLPSPNSNTTHLVSGAVPSDVAKFRTKEQTPEMDDDDKDDWLIEL